MKTNLLRASALTLTLATAFASLAMPARPGVRTIVQPDGSTIPAYLYGDENRAIYISEEGRLLLPNEYGTLCFATFDEHNRVVASTVKAAAECDLDTESREFIAKIDNDALLKAYTTTDCETKRQETSVMVRKIGDQITDYPASGERKVLVILAAFSDRKFFTENPAKAIGDMLNKEGYSDFEATGSVRDYFIANSAGQYKPQMMVYGPVTLPNSMSYYGAPGNGMNDVRPGEMIRDACKLIDDEVDFKEYDLDGDGYIDNVYVFYPGYSQADGADPNTIWPHAAYAWDKLRAEFDGVRLDHYACSNEIAMTTHNIVGIGTFCHEFSHVLGLPDLYDIYYKHAKHPGAWSLMANGGYNNNGHTPPFMSAYERTSLGWLKPEALTADGVERNLTDMSTNCAYRISTAKNNEYFLVENRQQKGWDKYLPGHGMLIWHIDYDKQIWESNKVNIDASHQRIDLVEADKTQGDDSRPGDAFPGISDVTDISGYTSPGLKAFDGSACEIALCNIRETPEGSVLFHPTNPGSKLSAPIVAQATEVTPVSFNIDWEKVEGATSYMVNVYRKVYTGASVSKEYVDGYRLLSTQQNAIKVEGLRPATEYAVNVRAVGGTLTSDYSHERTVTTLDKDFTFFAPETTAPLNVTSTSFTATWLPLEGATDYMVNVYEVNYVTTITESNDISDGIAAPEGWASSSNSTSPFPGYYGNAAPGLSMSGNDDFLRTPLHANADVTKITFWYRGTSIQDGNKIEISGYTSMGEWKQLTAVDPVLREKPGYTVVFENTDITFPCSSIAFIYRRPYNAGSVAVDDVVIEYSIPALTPVTDYTNKATGNALKMEISGLKPNTLYRYEVRAMNGTQQSLFSVPRNVRTSDSSGIEDTMTDTKVISISQENGVISVLNESVDNKDVEIYGIDGSLLHRTRIAPGTSTYWIAPIHGIYILRADNQSYKISL